MRAPRFPSTPPNQAGATAALRLLGHSFPWNSNGSLRFTTHNHTSAVGLRELAAARGADVSCVHAPLDGMQLSTPATSGTSLPSWLAAATTVFPASTDGAAGDGHHLFVLPAECNFSGVKTDLRLVQALQRGDDPSRKWLVALDAAKFAATAPLDLATHRPAFVAVSFYKMFGFPTGLGALIVRSDVAPLLSKPYFGGGTRLGIVPETPFSLPAPAVAQRLEDGTVDFLGVMSLTAGFDALERAGGMRAIRASCHDLTRYAYARLVDLHRSGAASAGAGAGPDVSRPGVVSTPACDVYGCHAADDPDRQGPILTFNLKHADGSVVPPADVAQVLALHGVSVRSGCMCNPGACHRYLCVPIEAVEAAARAGSACGTAVVDGKPLAAVRASFGYMTTRRDVDAMFAVLKSFFGHDVPVLPAPALRPPVAAVLRPPSPAGVGGVRPAGASPAAAAPPGPPPTPPTPALPRCGQGVVALTVYPVKSCRGVSVPRWPLGPRGLLYDREWCVTDADGNALTQKTEPRLALIQPTLVVPGVHGATSGHSDASGAPPPHVLALTADGYGSVTLQLGDPCTPSPLLGAEVVMPASLPPSDTAPLQAVPALRSRSVTVCGAVCRAVTYSVGEAADAVSKWLAVVLGRSVLFARVAPTPGGVSSGTRAGAGSSSGPSSSARDTGPALGFANNGQFLLISDASVKWLQREMLTRHAAEAATDPDAVRRKGTPPKELHASFFRPNVTVGGDGLKPFAEDEWTRVYVGGVPFSVTGDCQRCRMINIDQTTGQSRPRAEPLLTLAKTRRSKGGVFFGRFMATRFCDGLPQRLEDMVMLEVGMPVRGVP